MAVIVNVIVIVDSSRRQSSSTSTSSLISPGGHTRVHAACFLYNLYKSVDKFIHVNSWVIHGHSCFISKIDSVYFVNSACE